MKPPPRSEAPLRSDQAALAGGLGELAGGLLLELEAAHCSIWLTAVGTLISTRIGRSVTHSWLLAPSGVYSLDPTGPSHPERSAQWRQPAPNGDGRGGDAALRVEIRGREGSLGELCLMWTHARRVTATDRARARGAAEACSRMAERARLTPERAGAPSLTEPRRLPREGTALARLMRRVAVSRQHVLIVGERGSGRRELAYLVHRSGSTGDRAFVDVQCDLDGPDLDPGAIQRAIRKAGRGSVFFHGVDRAPPETLLTLLRTLRTQCLVRAAGDAPRLMASIERWPPADALPELLSVLSIFDVLRLEIPPLRERPEDIRRMVECLLADADRGDADAAWLLEHCLRYTWPGNEQELERTVSRISVLCDDLPTTAMELAGVAPELLRGTLPTQSRPARPASAHPGDGLPLADVPSDEEDPGASAAPREAQRSEQWIARLIAGDLGPLHGLHPGVRRALPYIANHFTEPLSLDEVASRCAVSPRYLSALLREAVGLSFKPLVVALRVERGAALLTEDPQLRITEVAFAVGCADLSHFERLFRRRFGVSPRDYRRLARATLRDSA